MMNKEVYTTLLEFEEDTIPEVLGIDFNIKGKDITAKAPCDMEVKKGIKYMLIFWNVRAIACPKHTKNCRLCGDLKVMYSFSYRLAPEDEAQKLIKEKIWQSKK